MRAGRRAQRLRRAVSLVLAVLAAVFGYWLALPASSSPASSSSAAGADGGAVFGVNMSLRNAYDDLLTDPPAVRFLARWDVPFVRLPMRPTLDTATLSRALRVIAAIGATPIAVLPGPGEPTGGNPFDYTALRSLDLRDVRLITSVFGDRTVYLEYGNEPDHVTNLGVDGYVASWNHVVPALRAAMPASYKMVGPVLAYPNADDIATFVREARPRPDLVSWHEYACRAPETRQQCDQNVAEWTGHAQAVNAAERRAVGTALPFLVSEWNVDAASGPADTALYQDAAFIQAWTARALRRLTSLVPLGMRGAAIYTATDHGDSALIGPDLTLTPQGLAFETATTTRGGMN